MDTSRPLPKPQIETYCREELELPVVATGAPIPSNPNIA